VIAGRIVMFCSISKGIIYKLSLDKELVDFGVYELG
jgi:hypothetical protein